jgi:hypothetical protein
MGNLSQSGCGQIRSGSQVEQFHRLWGNRFPEAALLDKPGKFGQIG